MVVGFAKYWTNIAIVMELLDWISNFKISKELWNYSKEKIKKNNNRNI